ncbi:MAG: hypothetical protein NTW91_03480 [Verrucomicrobia bacterium]|nr:hypothetical protein [Verrucomicrobiota bacterium]
MTRYYMSDELNQYIEAGKITEAAATALSNLTPGAFCTHRSWGFGRIAAWELITGQITIYFGTKKGHPMQLQYAAETLTFIPAEHILARAVSDAGGVRAQASSDRQTAISRFPRRRVIRSSSRRPPRIRTSA